MCVPAVALSRFLKGWISTGFFKWFFFALQTPSRFAPREKKFKNTFDFSLWRKHTARLPKIAPFFRILEHIDCRLLQKNV